MLGKLSDQQCYGNRVYYPVGPHHDGTLLSEEPGGLFSTNHIADIAGKKERDILICTRLRSVTAGNKREITVGGRGKQ